MGKVSVFIINYNGKNTVLKTIESIYRMEEIEPDIQVIDDCSTDSSPEIIVNAYPHIQIHKQPFNTGKPNILRNQAIKLADTPRLLITDNDVLFNNQCLKELLKVMDQDDGVAACVLRLMYWDEPKRIYSAGTRVHYLGAAIGLHRGEIIDIINHVPFLSTGGGILLLDRSKALQTGGFDEDYLHGWGEDGEFYQRLILAGYKCLYVPTAFAYHESKVHNVRRSRAAGQIYNRWQFILTHYSSRTIVFLMPAFFLYEIMQFLFLLLKRMPLLYFKANLMALRSLPMIFRKRKTIQGMKIISDKDVLFSGMIFVSPYLLKNNCLLKLLLKSISQFFDIYWKLIRPFIP